MSATAPHRDAHDDRNAAYVINSGADTPEQREANEKRMRLNGCKSFKHVPYDPPGDPHCDAGPPAKALRTLGFIYG